MATGTLRLIDHTTGSGVITPDDGATDLFFRSADVEPFDRYGMTPGARVRFDRAHHGRAAGHLMLERSWLEWAPELDTGHVLIDLQHQALFARYRDLLLSLSQRGGIAEFRRRFRLLLHAAAEHFADEEELMRRLGSPDLEAHAEQHRKLLKGAEDLRFNVDRVFGVDECAAVAKYLRHWVVHHLETWDSRIPAPEASGVVGSGSDPWYVDERAYSAITCRGGEERSRRG